MILLRRTLLVLLAVGVVTGSGCVYWRLLKFKHQLNDFSAHFAFASDSSYALVCLHPLLDGGDVEGLMEVAPSRYEQGDGLEWRVYAFFKEPADGTAPLVYRLGFAEDRLARIEFPTQFTQLYPEESLRELLAALGSADVDRSERSARARLAREQLAAQLPDRARLAELLGEPSERGAQDEPATEGGESWTYRYRLDTVTQGAAERKRRAKGEFRFDAEGRLTQLTAGIGKHVLRFDVEAARGDAPAAPDDGSLNHQSPEAR